LAGDLLNVYEYLKGRCQEDEAKLFSVVPSDRTSGNRHKLKDRKFHLNLEGQSTGIGCPGGFVESLSLEIFKIRLGAVLCSLLQVNLLYQGDWTR